jgi:post-segregation antitoxin (ccd killing protein)
MAVDTEKRNLRQYAWQKENRERISFLMEKGTKERINTAAQALNINASEFIRQAIDEKLNKTL